MRHCPLFVGHMRTPLVAPFHMMTNQFKVNSNVLISSLSQVSIFKLNATISSSVTSIYSPPISPSTAATCSKLLIPLSPPYLTFCRSTKLAQRTSRFTIQPSMNRFYYVSKPSLTVMGSGSKASSTLLIL